MTILFSILGLIITFITVVAVHELGHYFAARHVGVKAEIFSIGFGKPLVLRTDKRGMIWQIAAWPIGGYVRFVGDENAASLSSEADAPALPGSLRSVSHASQAIVAVSGPLANFALAILLFVFAALGSETISHPWRISGMSDLAIKSGFENGDELLQVGDLAITTETRWSDAVGTHPTHSEVEYLLRRDGLRKPLLAPRLNSPIVGFVADDMPASGTGLSVGDVILGVGGKPIGSWPELQDAVAQSNGMPISLLVEQEIGTTQISISPELRNGRWLLGLDNRPLLDFETSHPSILEASSLGLNQTLKVLIFTSTGLTATILGRGEFCELNGPITITRVAGQAIQMGPEIFLTFVAVISLGLGILNLLPIPILDGGHLLSLGIEGATGHQLGRHAKAFLFIAGVTGVAWLSIMALISDLTC